MTRRIQSCIQYSIRPTVKRVYFCWGKFCGNVGETFHNNTHFSLIKSYGFYLCAGEILAKNAILQKMGILPPCELLPTNFEASEAKRS